MQNTVHHQSDQIRQVAPFRLAGAFTTDLYDFNCTWYLHCESNESPKMDLSEYLRTHPLDTPLRYREQAITDPAPEKPTSLFYVTGPLPIPTFHTIFGTPHALRAAAASIGAAGGWAVLMFISCTILYFAIWLLLARGDDNRGFFYLWMIMAAPIGIPLVVAAFQLVAGFFIVGVNWALGLLIYVASLASALSLIVAVPHIVKAPREVLEAAESMHHL